MEGLKHEQKTKEANMEKINVEVLSLREALTSKERELAEKNSYLAEVDSLKEQLAHS